MCDTSDGNFILVLDENNCRGFISAGNVKYWWVWKITSSRNGSHVSSYDKTDQYNANQQ
jgi:hypothetical protein